MTVPEENHASIRLQIDQPASNAEVAVDEQGQITVSGILHKHATMVDIWDRHVTSTNFTLGPPPADVSAWASSWTTTVRPPNLGENQVCARADREPGRHAIVQRSFTVVDLIPPSNVPDVAVSNISATGALVTWGEASDNYGLAGYEVTVDGGGAHRTGVGVRSFTITGLEPSTDHTVSVVAIDFAGNTSVTPATASFTNARGVTTTQRRFHVRAGARGRNRLLGSRSPRGGHLSRLPGRSAAGGVPAVPVLPGRQRQPGGPVHVAGRHQLCRSRPLSRARRTRSGSKRCGPTVPWRALCRARSRP